ncbi:MAG: tetratricopeptide repeat protein [Ardenticatenaceae bacterium]|nr:tetratricopeptide repeat protein [Ardenticatenaceae bacterium]
MTTFDLKNHFLKAVTANLRLWQRRLLVEADTADDWRMRHQAIWQAVEEGLRYISTQADAAELMVGLLRTIERWGAWSDWMPLFDTAISLEMIPDLQIRVRLVQARLYNLNRNFSDAVALLNATLLLIRRHQLLTLEAMVHYRFTNAYLGEKDYSSAREHARKALDLLSANQLEVRASIYNSLGIIELNMDALPESEACFLQALSLWAKVNEPTQLARSCLNLSIVYQKQARWEKAKAFHQQATTALSNSDNVVDKLKALNELGTLHYMTGDFSSAVVTLRQGVMDAGELQGMYHLHGSLTHNLGNTLLALGQLTEARGYLEKSIRLWQQANDTLERANSVGTLGEVFEEQAEWALAAHSYTQAIELLDFYPGDPWGNKLAAQFKSARARCIAIAESALQSS